MKKALFLITLAIASVSFMVNDTSYKEGDIVFQMSTSSQSPLIQYATASPWSHCGIVVEKNKQLYVLEASSTVKLTPIKEWTARGRLHKVKKVRVIEQPVKVRYKQYLGIPYDLAFKFNNGKYYCSELVWEIYKKQFGIELCKPRKISEYNIAGLKDKMKKRGMSPDQLVVAPSDLIQ